jgi:hypothetical protein
MEVNTSRNYHNINNIPFVLVDIQKFIDNNSNIFEETPKGSPPVRDHMHVIHFQLGSVPPNIRPYRYPYVQNSEIESMIQEMLESKIIQPSQSAFSSPMVMVTKNDGS